MDNLPITLSLPLQSVNAVLTILGKRPFEEVASIITAIQAQAQSQLDVAQRQQFAPPAPAAEPAKD